MVAKLVSATDIQFLNL